MWSTDDTIAAIASPQTPGLRSIVRLSGPNVAIGLKQVFVGAGEDPQAWLAAKTARRWSGELRLPLPWGEIPCDMLYWPTTQSYTRQPSVELHVPGNAALAESCLQLVCEHGARLAQPGEFTMRAFLAGRIDLPQAEAVLGVIDASSEAELKVALRQLSGNLSQPLANARAKLLEALAHLEAGLDFADEDIEFISNNELRDAVATAAERVDATLAQVTGRGQNDGPPRVVLYGQPNSGKSSLFNRLCDGHAIVSPQAGTTRDYLTAFCSFSGSPCQLIDTAGLDPSLSDDPDQQSQALGKQQIEQAQVRVLCLDVASERTAWEIEQLASEDPLRLVVSAKCDLIDAKSPTAGIQCSSATGEGLDELRAELASRLSQTDAIDVVASTATRSRESLRLTQAALKRAQEIVSSQDGEELVALELRAALEHLGDVAGQLHSDEVLDHVFRQFCIGK